MVKLVTALFDIGRENTGDGRTMEHYLNWFGNTLNLKTPMVIYTEERFREFVEKRRNQIDEYTKIVIQDLSEIPMYKHKDRMNRIIKNPSYISKIKDPSRIECNLDLYNIIQYSKFGWLEREINLGSNEDFYFWIDAGCSRFFNDFDLDLNWPNVNKLMDDKFIIQGNVNTMRILPDMDTDTYKWDNNCILVGTLFGGKCESILEVSREVIKILEEEMINMNMVNNEQIALGILYKRRPDLFSVYINLDGGHLPLFKHLGV
jgi:hypothetical protein